MTELKENSVESVLKTSGGWRWLVVAAFTLLLMLVAAYFTSSAGVPLALFLVVAMAMTAVRLMVTKMRLTKFYHARPVLYRVWIDRFGDDRKSSVQRFIRLYAQSFFIDRKVIHKLGPDDGVMDYYHREYEPGEADGLETVYFAKGLKKEFNYTICEQDGQLTLGELFSKVTRQN